MRYTARHKLNKTHFNGAILIGAVFAAIAGSWPLFVIIVGALVASSVHSGEIRVQPGRRR